MKKNATTIRNDLRNWKSYSPGDSAWKLAKKLNISVKDLIKLNANENPYGSSPRVKKMLATNLFLNYYPDSLSEELIALIAKYTSSRKENIVLTSGSDELIDLLFRLFLEDGDEIINCPPTFGMYALYAKLNRGKVKIVPRKKDFSIDISEILTSLDNSVKMIIVCNPNNPTGTLTPLSEIEILLQTGKLVVVDEAYYEFAELSAVQLLKKYNNLVVLRTLSKWAGLAGVRFGYGILQKNVAEKINAIKSPFNVNLIAQLAATETFKDLSFAEKTIGMITKQREKMFYALNKIKDITVYPSKGNFLFVEVRDKKYKRLKQRLFQKNIAVRFYSSADSGKGMRITIGKPEQNKKVLQIIKTFYE